MDNNKISIFFPGDYLKSRFGNEDGSFFVLKSKHLNDYNVAITHLNEEHGSENIDYKMYHFNFLRNDEYTDHN